MGDCKIRKLSENLKNRRFANDLRIQQVKTNGKYRWKKYFLHDKSHEENKKSINGHRENK